MPEYITGYQNTVQALSPGASVVTVTGTISAYGSAGAYLVNVGQGLENLTFDAALFGPQSAHFTITNTGLIETAAGNPANLADAGIVLANTGHIFNAGTVLGGSGVAVLAQAGPAYIENSRCIAGSIGVAIVGFDGPVTLVNSGSLAGHKEGVFLTAGGVLGNAVGGLISGVASYGFDSLAQTTLTNAGTISGFYGGVNLQNGQGLVTNTGLIQAIGDGATQFYGGILTSDGGSVFNAGTITGENGIAVQYGNSVDPAGISGYAKNTGLIEASTTIAQGALGVGGQGGFGVGIALNMRGTVVNAGFINASNAGILSQNNGTGLVAVNNAATGRITGAKYGVYLKAGGTANNAGTIFVGEQGMSSAGAGTLINSGAVTATTLPFTVAGASGSYIATGLYVRGGGLIDNRYNGVVTVHYGDGLFMQAVNFGPGTQTLEDGNINNAGIVQAFEGVYETSLGTFTNSGEIAASQAGFLSPRARSTVFNAGTISAITTLFSQDSRADGFLAGGIGVYIDGGTVNNTGLINGNHAAIAIDALPGTVLNMAGASLSSNYGYGVVLSGGGVLVNQGGITGCRAGIRDQNDILTVNNSGYIGATAATFTTNGTGSSHGLPAGSYASQGVLLKDGGSVFNSSSGTIIGESGVNIQINPAAYVSNAGFIDGLGRTGVYLKSGGFTTNHGTIRALKDAIEVYGAGTVTNTGLVSSTKGHGIYVKGLATMFNAGSVIGGNQGVLLAGGGTIVNAGTIIGGTGDAVSFASGTENLLAIDPGAGFRGTVDGGNLSSASGFSVLDLAPGAATLLGVGTEFINFNEIDFAAGADWTVRGDTAGLASGALIDNFGFGDVLDLTDVADMPQRLTISPDGLLTIPGAVATVTMSFSNAAGDIVTVTGDGSGGTDIRLANALCFCAGTRIRTALGEVPVEDLAVGDMLQTVSGAMRPLSWIGRRHYDGRFIGNNHLMLPVRIGAGALAPGVPARDLFLSPGHAVFCGGILVPAWRLINGVTVTQAGQVDEVQYFHLELETHDVILAENCPAESFLDDGSRAQFQNALGFAGSGPVAPGLPRVEHGPVLQALCERLGASRRQHPSRRLRGFVDAAGPGKISGWAQDAANPETPVWLDIMLKGRRIRRVLANQYRADLRAAGLGSGCQSFELAMPAGPVVVQDAATGEVLAMTEAARRAA